MEGKVAQGEAFVAEGAQNDALERYAVVGHHAEVLREECLGVKVRVNRKGLVGEGQGGYAVERERYGIQASSLCIPGIGIQAASLSILGIGIHAPGLYYGLGAFGLQYGLEAFGLYYGLQAFGLQYGLEARAPISDPWPSI